MTDWAIIAACSDFHMPNEYEIVVYNDLVVGSPSTLDRFALCGFNGVVKWVRCRRNCSCFTDEDVLRVSQCYDLAKSVLVPMLFCRVDQSRSTICQSTGEQLVLAMEPGDVIGLHNSPINDTLLEVIQALMEAHIVCDDVSPLRFVLIGTEWKFDGGGRTALSLLPSFAIGTFAPAICRSFPNEAKQHLNDNPEGQRLVTLYSLLASVAWALDPSVDNESSKALWEMWLCFDGTLSVSTWRSLWNEYWERWPAHHLAIEALAQS